MTAHNGNTEQDERGNTYYGIVSTAYRYPAFLFLDKESNAR